MHARTSRDANGCADMWHAVQRTIPGKYINCRENRGWHIAYKKFRSTFGYGGLGSHTHTQTHIIHPSRNYLLLLLLLTSTITRARPAIKWSTDDEFLPLAIFSSSNSTPSNLYNSVALLPCLGQNRFIKFKDIELIDSNYFRYFEVWISGGTALLGAKSIQERKRYVTWIHS